MNKHYTPKILFILLFSLCCTVVHAQKIEWEKSYGGKHSEYLTDVVPTADNGFLLAGSSYSNTDTDHKNLDYFVWKIDENGKEEWKRFLGGDGKDLLKTVKITSDGGYLLGGQSSSGKSGDKKIDCIGGEDIWVLKLTAFGEIEWQLALGGQGRDILNTIIHTLDGGYLIGATSSSDNYAGSNEAVESNDKESKVIYKDSNNFGSLDYWIVKIDKGGNLIWQHSYGGLYADVLKGVVALEDGGFILSGVSNSPEFTQGIFGNSSAKTEKCYGMNDYWVLRVDKSGTVLWQNVYGGEQDDELTTAIKTNRETIIVGGNSGSKTDGNKNVSNGKGSDFWILELDYNGDIIRQHTVDIGKFDHLQSLLYNNDGSLLIGGFAKSEVIGTRKSDKEGINDYVLIKLNSEWEELWRSIVGSSGEDILKSVIETRDGGYLLSGTSFGMPSRDRKGGNGRGDIWVVKLRDIEKPKVVINPLEAIPNPVSALTNIVVGFDFEEAVMTLYDLGGRQIQSSVIQNRIAPINLQGLPSGVYIVEVKSKKDKGSVKIIKTQN